MSDSSRDGTVRLADLARDLDVDYRALRGWVSRTFPRAASDVSQPWYLGPEMVQAARHHFARREDLFRALPLEQSASEVLVRRLPLNARTDEQAVIADWFWEGHVVAALARALAADGWTIRRMADTGRREQGVDLVAELDRRMLMVEVKGYPTTTYARGPKAGQTKPTLPANQARQWFSHALLECLLMRSKYPDAEVAMAFPQMETYLRLVERTRPSIVRLGFGVYSIASDGSAQVLVRADGPTSAQEARPSRSPG